MNKQALAFLTMFSLVLMLSVYYVTLPSDSKTVMAGEKSTEKKDTSIKKDAKKETAKKSTSESNAAGILQESINQKKETAINKNNEVVANAKSSEAEKQGALSDVEVIKNEQSEQKSIVEELGKDGLQSAVEINNTTCIISIFDQKDDQAMAKKVMNKVSQLTNNKYLVEVAFK